MSYMFSTLPESCPDCIRALVGTPTGEDEVEVKVTAHADDPDADFLAHNREGVGDFSVFFGDEAAHEYQQLVQGSVEVVASFPGVERAVQEDRELIYGWGNNVDLVALHQTLVQWWRAQLSEDSA